MKRRVSVVAACLLLAGPVNANEIWMFAGPHIATHTPGWEGVRGDTGDLWKPDAPWKTVASVVKVIEFPPTVVDRASDSDLREAFADIKRRNMAFSIGTGLLIRSDRCRAQTEAYVDQKNLEGMFEKLRRSGADVKYVSMDEPFFYGHRDSGLTACHESAQALAQALKQSIAIVRTYFPNAQFGSSEVVDDSGPWVQDLAKWADTFKAVTGEPLAYIHADLTWTEGAVRNLVPLAAALKQRHVPLGIIYDADATNSFKTTDENFARNTISHFALVESKLGVHPDHAFIDSWVHHPTRMLPETQPFTVTNIVLQYIQRERGGR